MGKEVCSGLTFVIEKPGGAFGAASVTEERIKHEGTKTRRRARSLEAVREGGIFIFFYAERSTSNAQLSTFKEESL